MSFQDLDDLNQTVHALDHALSVLSVDEAVNMPTGGGEARAEALATLAGIRHEHASDPKIRDLIEGARKENLTEDQRTALEEFDRVYTNLVCLPVEFVRRKTETTTRTEQAWRSMRPANDWKDFEKELQKVVDLAREESQLRAEATGLSPYDALMDQFDPGNRAENVTPVFTHLKSFLKDFLPEALAAQAERLAKHPLKPVIGPFPKASQKALAEAVMPVVGFDFTHGRLDESHHPFCGGVPTDVRMTTRYTETEFLTSLLAVLHETGHALYEQGLERISAHWPHTQARGMGMHESQSLFVEMQIARSREFWEWARVYVDEHIGTHALEDLEVDDIMAIVNHIEPGYIRVDADEVTYPLHVILRYELESGLIGGNMQVSDIPELWDAKMKEYLGISTIDNPKDGPMQDVHWPAGLFGYFPSYTLGAMMAAQQWAAMEKANPGARQQIAKGDFTKINDWRRDNIWRQGSRFSTPEIMRRATGEELNADFFINHLKKRYL